MTASPPARILLLEEPGPVGDAVAGALAAAGLDARRVPGGAAELADALGREEAGLVVAARASADPVACAELRAACGDRAGGCILVCPGLDAASAVALMRAGAMDVVGAEDLGRLAPAVARGLDAARERRERTRASDGLTALLRGAADVLAIVVADRDGVVTDWGAGAVRMLGHSREDVVGRADLTIGHESADLAAMLAAAREGAGSQRETWLVRRDGSRFPALHAVVPLRDAAGEVTGYLASARDITRRHRAAEEHAALHRVATAVATGSEPEVVFARIAREAATIMDGDAGGVSRVGGLTAPELGTWAREGVQGKPLGASTPLDGTSAVAVVSRTGRGAHVDDLWQELDAPTREAWDGLPGFRAVAASPVRVSGETWGALWVGSVAPGAFGAEDEARLTRFADLAGLAIANAEARERIVSDALAGMFRGELDVEGTIDLVVTAARRAMGADRATCYIHDEGGGAVVNVVSTETDRRARGFLETVRGLDVGRIPLWRMLLASESRTMVIEDLDAEPSLPAGLGRGLGARALVGIRLEHPSVDHEGAPAFLGSLFLSFRQPRRFNARERAAAESLAGMAAVALANARLHAESLRRAGEVRAHATTDPLTGAANHRAFQERLTHEVTRARRHGRSLSLALIDIDHFRRVNERHGHEAGDRVLVEIAGLLRSAARDADLVARTGGEELAWLMPETDAMSAWQAVDRAREVVARMSIVSGMQVTVSAGVCDLAQAGSAAELVRLAEGALYWAKQHGRDVAFLYSPAVVEELSAEERADRLARVQALQSIRVLARAVDAKDPSTLEHSQRVADLAVALATALGWEAERLVRLREAGLVHDVGKIGVPDAILSKPARLTDEEYQEAKRHVSIGAEMVADVLTSEQVAWVRGHHEHWDGRGYPDGLAGEAISDGARVLALADAWDVMTSQRSYHEPLATEQALAECRRCAGTQFAPELVEALAGLVGAGVIVAAATASARRA